MVLKCCFSMVSIAILAFIVSFERLSSLVLTANSVSSQSWVDIESLPKKKKTYAQ